MPLVPGFIQVLNPFSDFSFNLLVFKYTGIEFLTINKLQGPYHQKKKGLELGSSKDSSRYSFMNVGIDVVRAT